MADIYTLYEAGLQRLLERLGPKHSRYSDALLFQQRLQENLQGARRYGDTESRRAERAEVLDRLNSLSLAELGLSFNDLCQAPAAAGAGSRPVAAGQRGVSVGGNVIGSTIITGDSNVVTRGTGPAPQPAAHTIFISYDHGDADWMHRIQGDLAAAGLDAWVDESDLVPGNPAWDATVAKAISQARAVVVILSPDAKDSNWVGRELGYAEMQKVRIVPILVRGERRDAVPIRLVNTQCLDARKGYPAALQRLVKALKDYLGR